MPSPHEPLDELLSRWRVTPPPTDRLTAAVRRRLASGRLAPTRPTLGERLEVLFGQPAFAAMFVAACVLLGLFVAELRLTRRHAERSTQIAQSYLQLVDPFYGEPAIPPATVRSGPP